MKSKGSIGLLDTLGKCLVIFSSVGYLTMAAEVPDQHMDGLGRQGAGRNGLSVGNMGGHGEGK